MRLPALLACLILSGCDDCDYSGYAHLRVQLVSASPAPPSMADGCAVFTDLPTGTDNPDQYGAALRHIGRSIYACLTGTAQAGTEADAAFYDEDLWFRVDGACPNNFYGCFESQCRTVNTDLAHIGPQSRCPAGTPMSQWTEACWDQFYAVLGHEIMHGWLGEFHS